MRSVREQAAVILNSVLRQDYELRRAGVKAASRLDAMQPGLEALLSQFQTELLDAQRASAVMLEQALAKRG